MGTLVKQVEHPYITIDRKIKVGETLFVLWKR
jgi:hypothetical protein